MSVMRKSLIIVSIIFIIMILTEPILSRADVGGIATIYIDKNGVAHVVININISRGLNMIQLPIKPIVATLEAQINGSEIPIIYSNDTLYLASPLSGEAVIRYIAVSIYRNNSFELYIGGQNQVRLVANPEIILLIDPSKIISSNIYPNNTLEILVQAPINITYMIKVSLSGNETTTITTGRGESDRLLLIIAAVTSTVAAAASATYFFLTRSRRRVIEELREILDNVDMSIIRYLEQRGGSAMQSEIQRDLLLPKTTLWRHIRRLEREGFVRIEKIGQQNRIILIKKPKS